MEKVPELQVAEFDRFPKAADTFVTQFMLVLIGYIIDTREEKFD